MAEMGHNKPPAVVLELSEEEAAFLLENCESNMGIGMNILLRVQSGAISRETGEKTVALIESFRPIRDKLKKAIKE